MSAAQHRLAAMGRAGAIRILGDNLPSNIVGELVESKLALEPHLRADYEAMTDDQARLHFGPEEPLDAAYLRQVLRYFHAWRLDVLRERIGGRLADASFLDVGDTDGLMLKHLGKDGLGFNLAPAAVENIRSNGVRAELGDGHVLPFEDASFDYVLSFETLEHVEAPAQLLAQLARVCRPEGSVFVSIPWVPRTYIHPRDTSIQRGYGHVFEFSREDFLALLTHTPLELRWESQCDILGPPTRPAHRAFLAATRRAHIVAGTFRRFQFFELGRRASSES